MLLQLPPSTVREREMHDISAVAERNNTRYAGTLEAAEMLLEKYHWVTSEWKRKCKKTMFYTKGGIAMPISICIDYLNKPNTKYSQSRLSETRDLMWDTYAQNVCKFQVRFVLSRLRFGSLGTHSRKKWRYLLNRHLFFVCLHLIISGLWSL